MKNDVLITVHERGKLRQKLEGHNVWTVYGNTYLASMLAYGTFPTPERSDRLRYMGLGIGGVGQSNPVADAAPFSTSYPAGWDPNGTDGHSYDKEYPVDPPISTLERPVRISGGNNPYNTADPGDIWLIDATFTTHSSLTSVSLHSVVDASAGDVLGAFYPFMPISEVGLYTSAALLEDPFNPGLLAYFSFGTIQLNPDSVLEVVWTVRF